MNGKYGRSAREKRQQSTKDKKKDGERFREVEESGLWDAGKGHGKRKAVTE